MGRSPVTGAAKTPLWKMIAGLAIALYESSEDVRKNGKLNQSAVCEKAANNIAKYSEEYNDAGMTMDNLRTLLKDFAAARTQFFGKDNQVKIIDVPKLAGETKTNAQFGTIPFPKTFSPNSQKT